MGCISSSDGPSQGTKKSITYKTNFSQSYDLQDVLGQGSFAIVHKALKKTDKSKYAVKIINRTELQDIQLTLFTREVNVLKLVSNHKNIMQCYDVFEDVESYYLVLEYVDGGELFDRLVKKVRYSEKTARDTVQILVHAIKHCHDHNVVHRDLKPENLLLSSKEDDANIKIADFGLAQIVSDGGFLRTMCGTPEYIAPEILSNRAYGKAVDMWSIGVITYTLLGGYLPFSSNENDQRALFRKIKKGSIEFHPEYWDKVSEEAKDLVSGLLTVDPSKRLTADDVLNHPWILLSDQILEAINLDTNLSEFRKFNDMKKASTAIPNNNHDLMVMLLMLNAPNRGEDVYNLLTCHPEICIERDLFGRLPIHLSIDFKNSADVILNILAAYPLASKVRDGRGRLPLHVAVENKQSSEVVLALIASYPEGCGSPSSIEETESGSPTSFFHRVIEAGYDIDVVSVWLSTFPAAATIRDEQGTLPLAKALQLGSLVSLEVVKKLLNCYPEAACVVDANGMIPLALAFESRRPAELIVELLTVFPDACKMKHRMAGLPLHVALKSRASSELVLAVVAVYIDACKVADGEGNIPVDLAVTCSASDDVIQVLTNAHPEFINNFQN